MACKGAGPKARNLALAFNESGTEMACYSKLHPFSFAGETQYYESGNDVVTFPWGDFTVGLFICYDLRFPEVFRTAVHRGVDLFVFDGDHIAVKDAYRKERSAPIGG